MLYKQYLNLYCAASGSGKTVDVLSQLKRNPHQRQRIWIYSFGGDSQFDSVELACPLEVKSYQDFNADEIPPRTTVILDELNNALTEYPHLLGQIKRIFTTLAHHRDLDCVGIVQSLLGSPSFSLLRLTHAVTLHLQQSSNAELIRCFPVYKRIKQELETFFLNHQEVPAFVTFHINCPYQHSFLTCLLSVRLDTCHWLFISMNPNKDMTVLHDKVERLVRPFLDKDQKGLAVLPLDSIASTNHAHQERASPAQDLERQVRQMIYLNAGDSVRTQRAYMGLWHFIRNVPELTIDPQDLLLTFGEHEIGLQSLIALLLYPSHLKDDRVKKPVLPKAAVAITRLLLDKKSFNAAKIVNSQLKTAALKLRV